MSYRRLQSIYIGLLKSRFDFDLQLNCTPIKPVRFTQKRVLLIKKVKRLSVSVESDVFTPETFPTPCFCEVKTNTCTMLIWLIFPSYTYICVASRIESTQLSSLLPTPWSPSLHLVSWLDFLLWYCHLFFVFFFFLFYFFFCQKRPIFFREREKAKQ